jgi:hypothetical protein
VLADTVACHTVEDLRAAGRGRPLRVKWASILSADLHLGHAVQPYLRISGWGTSRS